MFRALSDVRSIQSQSFAFPAFHAHKIPPTPNICHSVITKCSICRVDSGLSSRCRVAGSRQFFGGEVDFEVLGLSSMADKKNSVTGKRKERSNDDEEQEIVWPPTVIVENTRLGKMEDGRWTGIGNQEMAQILQENGHTQGKAKSTWGKDGHRGIMVIQYNATAEGLQEAQRLHKFFQARGRGRDSWERIRPFWHALPGHEGLDESSDFVVEDDKSGQRKRVLYGYLALGTDVHKVPLKKKDLGCVTVRPSEILQLGPAASHFRTRRVWDAFNLEGKKKAAGFNRQGKKAASGAAACRPAGA